jgi:negative regulator of flagellin synthesis FlgM
MKINGIGPSNIVKMYNNNRAAENRRETEQKKDSLEISSVGRSLSAMSPEQNPINSEEKLEALRKAVAQGTYKPNAQQTAKKMIDIIKGRGI